jgi:hypothetical protein
LVYLCSMKFLVCIYDYISHKEFSINFLSLAEVAIGM